MLRRGWPALKSISDRPDLPGQSEIFGGARHRETDGRGAGPLSTKRSMRERTWFKNKLQRMLNAVGSGVDAVPSSWAGRYAWLNRVPGWVAPFGPVRVIALALALRGVCPAVTLS